MLEMRKNTRRRNPGGKDAKDPEDQDPIDTGQRNYRMLGGRRLR